MMWTFLALFLAVATAQPTQLKYNVGDFFAFDFASDLNHAAQAQGVSPTKASHSSMTGLMEMQVQDYDGKLYYFAMNLFNVDVEAGTGKKTVAPNDDGLGPDMYFSMTPEGQIPTIWYQDGDSQFFINVKASAINALQTRLVPANSPSVYPESDLIGNHTTAFRSVTAPNALNISKSFTQKNVIAFADKSVTQATFKLRSQSMVSVHKDGYIQSSFTTQQVLFVSIEAAKQTLRHESTDDNFGFNSNIFSSGSLQLVLTQSQKNTRLGRAKHVPKKIASSLFELGSKPSSSPSHLPNITTADELIQILESPKTTNYQQLRSVVKYLKANGQNVLLFSVPIEKAVEARDSRILLQRWLYVLGLVDSTESNRVLAMLLQSTETVRREVIKSLAVSKVTECSLVEAIVPYIQLKEQTEARSEAILTFGSLVRRCGCPHVKSKSVSLLDSFEAYANSASDAQLSYAVQAAKQNAGIELPTKMETSDFPFNKSYAKTLTLGGDVLNAQFSLDAFVGTNFDCNQKYFNYQASAVANGTVDFLGTSKSAFLGTAIYGKQNGNTLGDNLYLRIWDDIIVNRPIPNVDCKQHVYPLGEYKAPGFDVSYTLWVSIIPVTFTAAVDAEVDLSWSWQICDSSLSASVELIPNGKLIASATADSDLIVIEGGISLDADFDVTPVPKVFLDGSQCEVGFNVEVTYDPMVATLDAWWRKHECKYWIFDCHWGPVNNDQLWSWSAAQRHEVLVNEVWKIHK